jgi:hypothetical protein
VRLVVLSGNRLEFTGGAKGVTMELFSLQGRCVLRQSDRNIVPLARLPQGVYFARVIDKGKVIAAKKAFIVK